MRFLFGDPASVLPDLASLFHDFVERRPRAVFALFVLQRAVRLSVVRFQANGLFEVKFSFAPERPLGALLGHLPVIFRRLSRQPGEQLVVFAFLGRWDDNLFDRIGIQRHVTAFFKPDLIADAWTFVRVEECALHRAAVLQNKPICLGR